jgi:hypothetical protein
MSVEPYESIVETSEYVSVTVYRTIVDRSGNEGGRVAASCTTKEKRFKRRDGKGYVFDDAREVLHDCRQMAEKRAEVLLVRGALGLTAFLAAEDEMDEALQQPEKPLVPWSEDEKRRVYAAAADKGIGKRQFATLVQETLGRPTVGTGPDVVAMLAAIAEWKPPVTATESTMEDAEAAELPDDAASDQLPLNDPPRRRNAVAEGR